MRTTQRDRGVAIFSASVADAPSGAGVAQPGAIPFTFVRTALGIYTITLDFRLTIVAANVNGNDTTVVFANVGLPANNAFTAVMRSDTSAVTNSGFRFTCTAIDKRT